jgi:peptidoglycan/xylan/chitin deacetylase (PgdA/CDA1 family)
VESHAVVFMYHRFGEPRYPSTSVRIDQFEAHLEWLARHDFSVWPLERLVAHLHSGEPIPDRTVAITVDDAYASVYRHAYPRLRKRGWPFTVFVSADPVDQRLPDYLRWDQMREMAQHGARFANHGASHTALWKHLPGEGMEAWRLRVLADMDNGARRLREELGTGVSGALFAYPYGEYDAALADLVAEQGYTGFGQHSGVIGARADRRALPRFPMAERYASVKDFATKAAALPLNVETAPVDPLAPANPPVLELALVPAALPWERLACYAEGEPITVRWTEPERRLQAFAPAPLPP